MGFANAALSAAQNPRQPLRGQGSNSNSHTVTFFRFRCMAYMAHCISVLAVFRVVVFLLTERRRGWKCEPLRRSVRGKTMRAISFESVLFSSYFIVVWGFFMKTYYQVCSSYKLSHGMPSLVS
jgi:hypothetical protein